MNDLSGERPTPPPEESRREGGLDQFRDALHPRVLQNILAWFTDPELGTLATNLEAIRDREKFLDVCAEAVIARYLLSRGCKLLKEVQTPSGRMCDFEVRHGGDSFFLHVKRLNTDRAIQKKLTVSSRLRYLERIGRPYGVGIRLAERLSDEQMQRYVTTAAEFIKQASVGDELVVRDDGGAELGGCRILAPWSGASVSLEIGLPSGFIDEAPRMRRLMRKAYSQFMPGAVNVILIGTSHEQDTDDFATALLGSHIERWDTPAPQGRRVAHGRDSDGVWSGRRSPGSSASGWFHFRPQDEELNCRLWIRAGAPLEPSTRRLLGELFDAGTMRS